MGANGSIAASLVDAIDRQQELIGMLEVGSTERITAIAAREATEEALRKLIRLDTLLREQRDVLMAKNFDRSKEIATEIGKI
jgi:hypothetical protein